jgi:hypothetical protein
MFCLEVSHCGQHHCSLLEVGRTLKWLKEEANKCPILGCAKTYQYGGCHNRREWLGCRNYRGYISNGTHLSPISTKYVEMKYEKTSILKLTCWGLNSRYSMYKTL